MEEKRSIGTATADLTEEDIQKIAAAYNLGVLKYFETTGEWKDMSPVEKALMKRIQKRKELSE